MQTVEHILYIGGNIQLAKAMLNLSTASQTKYCIDHLTCVDDIQIILTEKKYSHFICELPFNKDLADNIAIDFPLLKTNYLQPFTVSEPTDLSIVIEGLISDEVKATLDYLSIPIYFKNRSGEIVACNSHFSNLFGKTPVQMVGQNSLDILPAHLIEESRRTDQKVFMTNEVQLHKFTLQDVNGNVRDIVLRKECIANKSLQVGVFFDVTDVSTIRTSLEKEHLMLRAAVNISDDLIFFKDRSGNFLGCNKQFEKFVGCSEKQIIGKKDEQLFEFNQALMCQDQDQQVMTDNQVYAGDEYLTYKNGERHFIDMRKEPLRDHKGEVKGLIGIGRDITGHNKLNKRLKIADVAFQNSKECLLVADEQAKIVSTNKAFCNASGYSCRELIGLNVSIFRSDKHVEIKQAIKEKKSWQGELNYVKKNGNISFAWLDLYIVEHPETGGFNTIYSFIYLDQSEDVEDKIKHLAKYDPLTGIFNRIAFFSRLEDAIARAEYKETAMAVVLIDINDFKEINEKYGHNGGDIVLREVAQRLKSCVFEKDTVARFGNHEFTIIIDELSSEQDAAVVARKVLAQFEEKFLLNEIEIHLSAAIGIALCPDDGMDIDSLVDSAEEAMQRGKRDKDASYHFYTHELTCHSRQQFELEKELQQAIDLDQFELYFQPQYDLSKRQVVAVEALLRWNHPLHGVLHPDNFLGLAESSGLLVPISMLMLRRAAEQAVKWKKSGIYFGRINVILSQLQLEDNHFIGELQRILLTTKCAPQWLEFAIDETIFVSLSPFVHENLSNISKMGIAMMVDNYGADRPALCLIETLGIDKLKLARHYRERSSSTYLAGAAVTDALMIFGRALGVDIVDDTSPEEEKSAAVCNIYDPKKQWDDDNAMRASEATFYLRCNKRK